MTKEAQSKKEDIYKLLRRDLGHYVETAFLEGEITFEQREDVINGVYKISNELFETLYLSIKDPLSKDLVFASFRDKQEEKHITDKRNSLRIKQEELKKKLINLFDSDKISITSKEASLITLNRMDVLGTLVVSRQIEDPENLMYQRDKNGRLTEFRILSNSDVGYIPALEESTRTLITSGFFIKESLFSDSLDERMKRMKNEKKSPEDFIITVTEQYDQIIDSLINKKLIDRKGSRLRLVAYDISYIDPSTITNLSDSEVYVYRKFIDVL